MYSLILKCEIKSSTLECLDEWVDDRIEENKKTLEEIVQEEVKDLINEIIDETENKLNEIFDNINILNKNELVNKMIKDKIEYFKEEKQNY